MTDMARGSFLWSSEGATPRGSEEETADDRDGIGESSWACRVVQALLSGSWIGEPLRLADFVA